VLTMELYSTRNHRHKVGLREAVLRGLPPDNGLYMPAVIPELPRAFWRELGNLTFPELSQEMAKSLLSGAVPDRPLEDIIHSAIRFPAPLVPLPSGLNVLELFHGPSLAFKDFGARFMARLMSYFNRGEDRPLTILVATSGDTGGAVAAGFFDNPGIEVIILFPRGKVSPLQEKQLTTWGGNVTAIEVEGTFDDCQRLVKSAFLDEALRARIRLSSANSINIARLIPQSFYYAEGWKQLPQKEEAVFVVPSGNFGNLTAGLMAYRMGLPARHFVAATNANRVVPDYLDTGRYEARPSIATLSNAMDVGDPSIFDRLYDLHGSTWNHMRENITGFSFSDADTLAEIKHSYRSRSYLPCPHTAVGLLAAREYQRRANPSAPLIVLATAHPAKFIPVIRQAIGEDPPVPPALARLADEPGHAFPMPPDYPKLKDFLLSRT